MTTFVYGTPKTVLAIGIAPMNNIPTPFIAFADEKNLGLKSSKLDQGAENAARAISDLTEAGATIVYFENPEAAERLINLMADVFEHAVQGSWGDVQEAEVATQ